jgi:hypothetical protein
MNIQEITKRLYALDEAILEKTGNKPWLAPFLCIRVDQCTVTLYSGWNGGDYEMIDIAKGDTPDSAIDAADRIIAAMPGPEKAKLPAHNNAMLARMNAAQIRRDRFRAKSALVILCVAFGMSLAATVAIDGYARAVDAINNPHIEGF